MAKEDIGHQALLLDIEVLLQEVNDFAFHDFKNEKYATPKVALVNRLTGLIGDVKNGKYDNEPPEDYVCEICGGSGVVATDESDGEGNVEKGVGSRKCLCQIL